MNFHPSDRTLPASRLILGLNSGTSMDGVDAALVEFEGVVEGSVSLKVIDSLERPFPEELRKRLLRAPDLSLEETTRLHFEVAEHFALVARELIARHGVRPVAVGSHGQTVCHLPAGAGTHSLQIGDLDVLAERLELPVIGDFRARDLAAGGEGAPLSPYLDWMLFHETPGQMVVNLGGIANLTSVQPSFAASEAFDAGPANLPLDSVIQVWSDGQQACDRDGERAAAGTVDQALLAQLLADPWFESPPPRTTGREKYGVPFARDLLARYPAMRVEDLLATLCRFVAQALQMAVERFVRVPPETLWLAGGGVRNRALVREIEAAFSAAIVREHAVGGVDATNREAVLFAALADAHLRGTAANLPRATGARGPRVLGKLAHGKF